MLCQKKFHFLKRWSKHVLHWPHDTCMCFQAVCFRSFVLILGSIASFSFSEILYKSRRTFCFPFLQTLAICIFLPCLLVTCMIFWSKQVFQMLCYSLYHQIIAFLHRKSTVGLVLVSVSTYFGSYFNSPKKNR